MKDILVSLKPYFYYLIGEGLKKVEVRKNSPKADNWSKNVLAYMSKDEQSFSRIPKEFQDKYRRHWGKIGLKFVCDRIIDIPYSQYFVDYYHTMPQDDLEATCLCMGHIDEYLLSKNGYGWHISDLVIYDKPRELSEFYHYCGDNPNCEGCEAHYYSNTECGKEDYCCSPIEGCKPLKRPFQSWCYVESEGEG